MANGQASRRIGRRIGPTTVAGSFYQRGKRRRRKFMGSVTRRQPKWGAITVGGAVGHDNAVIPGVKHFLIWTMVEDWARRLCARCGNRVRAALVLVSVVPDSNFERHADGLLPRVDAIAGSDVHGARSREQASNGGLPESHVSDSHWQVGALNGSPETYSLQPARKTSHR